MSEFKFNIDPLNHRFVIIAPKRSKRPDVANGKKIACPFCYGFESFGSKEVARLGPGGPHDQGWEVRVIENRYPFAPYHEVIIHSPDHHKNFPELTLDKARKIIRVYKIRYQVNAPKGQVLIFNNHGRSGGESLTHPHTQLAVIPHKYPLKTPKLPELDNKVGETNYFKVYSPSISEWPWEVWMVPKKRNQVFGRINDYEIEDLGRVLQNVLIALTEKLGHEFPFNFYIYPAKDWYLRLMPRMKAIGGFELAAGAFVNTQDPEKTKAFLEKLF